MTTVFILIAVSLAAAIIVIIFTLIFIVIYQRWRINDNNAHLKKFIDENLQLRNLIKKHK